MINLAFVFILLFMKIKFITPLFILSFILIIHPVDTIFSQTVHLKHAFLLENLKENDQLAISLSNCAEVNEFIQKQHFSIKKKTVNWIFLTISGEDFIKLLSSPIAKFLYSEISEPTLLNDTSRFHHQVNEVHSGLNNLQQAYTGKGVLLGFVDTGVDFNHPDFKDSTGKTRVYSYWDQSLTSATSRSPQPYNYGENWTASEIDNGLCTAVDNIGHGTHVVGIAAGNGRANGKHRGMAPEATIVMVKTNNSAKNWTLTVADACDYIFKIADQLDKPCVINISYGVAMGSHDGNDPASELIESLLAAKSGRIVVAAAGNNGNLGKYHVHGEVTSDTSFFWVKSTTKGIAGTNSILLEMWADSLKFKDVQFATGVNLPSGTYALSGKTKFRTFAEAFNFAPNALRDTIFNANGLKLAYVDYYAEIINHEYHLQTAYTGIDSTNYLFQFTTTGTGSYDVWGGSANKVGSKNFNDFETVNIPSESVYPPIKNYILADTLQTVFSSYISSEKVMTVGNVSNKASYTTKDQIQHISEYAPGQIHVSSSKGPNRKGEIKPDIVASGTKIFSANPLSILNNPSSLNLLDQGGLHVLNSGTSMASPLVAGVAALYLEKCSKANYQDFKTAVKSSAKKFTIQGSIPNNAYGFGEINALSLLLSTNPSISILGDTVLPCSDSTLLTITATSGINSIIWSDFDTKTTKIFNQPGKFPFQITDFKNCRFNDTVSIYPRAPFSPKVFFMDSSKISCAKKNINAIAQGGKLYQWSGGTNTQNDTVTFSFPGKYLITITDSYGCTKLDSLLVGVDTLKPNISLKTIGDSILTCVQKTVLLKATGATNYRWNTGNISTLDSLICKNGGKYFVTGIGSNGCQSNDSILILSDTIPAKSYVLIKGLNKLTCTNKRVRLQVTGAYKYQWNGGTSLQTDTNSFTIGGNYTVSLVDNKGCKSQQNIFISEDYKSPVITLHYLSTPYITCDNEPVKVKTSGAMSYTWNAGKYLNKDSNIFVVPGEYIVTAVGSNGCINMDTINIERHFYPSIPIITQKDNLLIASTSPNYQWYCDGILLQNETNQSIVYQIGKTYFVSVVANSCIVTSKFYTPQISLVDNIETTLFRVFPNPTNTGIFQLEGIQENDQITAYDLVGNKISIQKNGTHAFQLENVVDGIYLIVVERNSERMLVKIIKN